MFRYIIIDKAIKREALPIVTLSVLDALLGSKIFSKIDLKKAYQQLDLNKILKGITNSLTEKWELSF